MEPHQLSESIRPMTRQEYAALVQDIRERGLCFPIVLHEGRILDGRHRFRACTELGIEPRFEAFSGPDPAAYVESANKHRRHLSIKERKGSIVAELKRDPSQSDRAIAEKAGCSHTTVAKARGEAEATGQIGQLNTTTGLDGKTRKRKRGEVGPAVDAELLRDPRQKDSAIAAAIGCSVSIVNMRRIQLAAAGGIPVVPKGSRRDERASQERSATISSLAAEGNTAQQIAAHMGISVQKVKRNAEAEGVAIPADKIMHKTHRIRPGRVFRESVSTLSGIAAGLRIVASVPIEDIDQETAKAMLADISEAQGLIRWMTSKLKEIANG